MEDSEINLAIAKIEHPNESFRGVYGGAVVRDGVAFVRCEDEIDYCNNWSDIGSIIEREDMFIAPIFDGWEASSINEEMLVKAETPTKAAALCYLRMKGVEV